MGVAESPFIMKINKKNEVRVMPQLLQSRLFHQLS